MPNTTRPGGNLRDRAATEQRIIDAVGRLLARDGFSELGVNALAREAGTDKTMIYRYFGGLPQLLEAYAARGDFWASDEELFGGRHPADLAGQPATEIIPMMLENWVDALRRRPITLEILAWETIDRNELTAVLEDLRARQTTRILTALHGMTTRSGVDLEMLGTVVVSAIHYLLIRARKIRRFGPIDFDADGIDHLKSFIGDLCRAYLRCGDPSRRFNDKPNS